MSEDHDGAGAGGAGAAGEPTGAEGDLRLRGRRPVRGWVIVAVVGGLALGVFLWRFPPWALARAHSAWVQCTNHIYRTGLGAASDCRQGGLLAIPRLVPWTRGRALQLASTIAEQEAEDAIALAAHRDLDRAALGRGIDALIAATHRTPPPEMYFNLGGLLTRNGGAAALVAHASELTSGAERAMALSAAIRSGDRDAVWASVTAAPPREADADWDRARGAVLCAFGRPADGIAALERADKTMLDATPPTGDRTIGDIAARLAMIVCDRHHPIGGVGPWADQASFVRALAGDPTQRLDDLVAEDSALAAASLLARAGVKDVSLYLERIASIYHDLAPTVKVGPPLAALDGGRGFVSFPFVPAWDDALAAQLVAFADAPRKPRRARDPASDDQAMDKIDDRANADPRPFLRWGAVVAELEATVGWVRRGDRARAEASARRALAAADHPETQQREPYAPLAVVPILELVGLDAEAVAAADGVLARLPAGAADARGMLAVQRAIGLVHLGRAAEAWEAIAPAQVEAADGRTQLVAGWLRTALALELGRPNPTRLPAAPEALSYDTKPDATLAYWAAAATADPEAQRVQRFRARDEIDPGYYDNLGVLSAQLYVVGKAAGTGDVELWLDAMTGRSTVDAQVMMAARAEAARWRGDAAAATAWDQRLAAMRALATDDRSAYLIDVALQ